MKKNILQYALALALTALILLGLTFGLRPMAQANAEAARLERMRTLLPGSISFTEEAYTGEDANIRSVHKAENGFVIETVTNGYVGEINALIGVSNEGTVTGLVIQDIHETLGLGDRARTDWQFLMQFLWGKGDAEIGGNVDAIAGATVTSKAVARCVNSAVAYVTGADAGSSATEWGG